MNTLLPSAAIEHGLPLIHLDPTVYLIQYFQPNSPDYCGCALGSLVLGLGVSYAETEHDYDLWHIVHEHYPNTKVIMPDGGLEDLHEAVDWLFSNERWSIEQVISYLQEQGL